MFISSSLCWNWFCYMLFCLKLHNFSVTLRLTICILLLRLWATMGASGNPLHIQPTFWRDADYVLSGSSLLPLPLPIFPSVLRRYLDYSLPPMCFKNQAFCLCFMVQMRYCLEIHNIAAILSYPLFFPYSCHK